MTKESFENLLRDAVKAAVVTQSAHGLRKMAATAGFPSPAGPTPRWWRRSVRKANSKSRTLWETFPHPLEQWLKKLVAERRGFEPLTSAVQPPARA